ncbi:hypothetical protein OEA41_006140 [Lepraria neglecta]|uniref:Uncharacterized protein n=1 Tax=Lepraria neglecta TaxID=209136 RepID=A0AAD9Z7F2_9LECA|nr:hypothetical protein OEA41_006140 [Lepraria neglecta]
MPMTPAPNSNSQGVMPVSSLLQSRQSEPDSDTKVRREVAGPIMEDAGVVEPDGEEKLKRRQRPIMEDAGVVEPDEES